MKATWNGAVLAESEEAVVVEGNHYFPPASIHESYFRPSEQRTVCGWKGQASYYNIVVDGEENTGAAWSYLEPLAAANEIGGYIAFWSGVEVES
jgi:uncharacterized protein (DUF427 family)